MKTTILGGIAVLCAAVAAAQTTPASQSKAQLTPSTSAEKTITLTGCVGSMPGAAGGFVLSNPIIGPSSPEAKGPAGEISSPPSSSQTATAAAPAAAGTAGTSGKSESKGYRLSGADMSSWSGKRVQLVGSVVPAATGANAAAADGNPGSTGETLPEFRVKTVQPTAGSCPEK